MKLNRPPAVIASTAASLWTAGARIRARLYETGLLRQKSLRANVISVGNISWGGTGKTPFTIWLAERLQAAGFRVSILTRGYGRTSTERVKVLPPGTSSDSARHDGDEVQLYLRYLKLPIGISSSRYEAGKMVEENYPVDVHLLDDGFQHLSLARNVDLVLVDAANPWGGRPGWPVLLREGFSSLRRADAVLLTRCELGLGSENSTNAIENLKTSIRRFSPDARCFMVRTKLLYFKSLQSEMNVSIESFSARRALAFCGVGNPRSFFRMLEAAGVEVVAEKIFPDHHRYSGMDLQLLEKLAQENRADCLVTTEKDIVNLPSDAAISLPLYWAAIEPAVDEEDVLMRWIREKLHVAPGLACTSSEQASIRPL